MSEGPLEPTGQPEGDSWRKLAIDAASLVRNDDDGPMSFTDYLNISKSIHARRDALLAAEDEHPPPAEVCTGVSATWCPIHGDCTCPRREGDGDVDFDADTTCPLHGTRSDHAAPVDEHPPTFHVRPVWVTLNGNVCKGKHPDPHYPEASCAKQWRWGAREANGEVIIPESEPLTHKQHALDMVQRTIDGYPGAKIVVEGDDA